MAWSPDLKWTVRVFRAVLSPNLNDPEDAGLRDPFNVNMAMKFARDKMEHLLAESRKFSAPGPVVTTLCGSSRFPDLHATVMMTLTLQGRVVIPLGCYGHADVPQGARFLTSDGDESTPEKRALDQLHFRKIDMSDGIFVVNPGGYVGSSTVREVAYAESLDKTVEWLFPRRT